ncbi:MAG: thioredoxin family protein [Bacteroidetes bacterium]|nr:thioredoxin family protein [Bacteroidota bacterium]
MTFTEALSSQQFVLADFYASWCEPCKWADLVVEEVVKKFTGKILLHKIDIDVNPSVARDHHILSVPTLVLFNNGTEVWRMRGFDTAPKLKKILDEFV